jgi:flagellar hook-basal body complex protein FliE
MFNRQATELSRTALPKITPDATELAGTQATAGSTQAASGPQSFGSVLDKFVNDVDGSLKNSQAEQTKVLSGESTNLHQAMIAMQEASTSFSLMVEVRNKLVESYQELMRMQV